MQKCHRTAKFFDKKTSKLQMLWIKKLKTCNALVSISSALSLAWSKIREHQRKWKIELDPSPRCFVHFLHSSPPLQLNMFLATVEIANRSLIQNELRHLQNLCLRLLSSEVVLVKEECSCFYLVTEHLRTWQWQHSLEDASIVVNPRPAQRNAWTLCNSWKGTFSFWRWQRTMRKFAESELSSQAEQIRGRNHSGILNRKMQTPSFQV